MSTMRNNAIWLAARTLHNRCSLQKDPDEYCKWINGDTLTVDETPAVLIDSSKDFVAIDFENMDGVAYTLQCIKLSNKIGCKEIRRANYLFSGIPIGAGCTASNGGSDPIFPDIDPDGKFDVEINLPDAMDTSNKKESVAVAISNYMKGAVVLFDGTSLKNAKTILDENSVAGDLVIRGFASTLVVINRYGGDNVQLFDAGNNFAQLHNFSTGAGSNPQDALLLGGTTLYATAYSTKDFEGNPIKIGDNPIGDLLIFDLAANTFKSKIDLSQYSTNQPNAATVIEAGSKVYALLQDLNAFVPETNGKLVIVDPETNSVIKKIELEGYNPVDMVYAGEFGKLFIASAGDFMTTDETRAGIETFDLVSQQGLGLIVKEDAIGNNATKVRIVNENLGVIATSNFNSSDISFVASFNPQTGQIINKKLYGTSSTNIADILVDKTGALWIADRDATGDGVIRINPETGNILEPMTTLEMPPTSMGIVE